METIKAEKHGNRYPWDEWFSSKELVTLAQGDHFHCEPYAMAHMARRVAGERGIARTIRCRGLTVEISPPDPRFNHLRKKKRHKR